MYVTSCIGSCYVDPPGKQKQYTAVAVESAKFASQQSPCIWYQGWGSRQIERVCRISCKARRSPWLVDSGHNGATPLGELPPAGNNSCQFKINRETGHHDHACETRQLLQLHDAQGYSGQQGQMADAQSGHDVLGLEGIQPCSTVRTQFTHKGQPAPRQGMRLDYGPMCRTGGSAG